nr:uncharacterized protein LOC126542008 [Dermacentor andersoni]
MCRILRSEIWRQVRLLYDWLHLVCFSLDPVHIASTKLQSLRKLAAQNTEFLWRKTLPILPKGGETKEASSTALQVLGGAFIPEDIVDVLKKGPKFSSEPRIPGHELLSLNRRISNKAAPEDKERCLLDGVDSLTRTVSKKGTRPRTPTRRIVNFFNDNDLRLLQADKEGGFVAMPSGMFNEKALQAIQKNFKVTKLKPSKEKSRAISLCEDLGLQKLASSVHKCRKNCLNVFFTAKTHKDDIPFRCIVSERASWQNNVSRYLLKQLNTLVIDDPFMVKNSFDVIAFLRESQSIGCLFSIDVVDLFYSIPQKELLAAVLSCIEMNGQVSFQNTAGISVVNFMALLEFYLCSTAVCFQGHFYVQRKGICIGSCVAPVLCNIFLAGIDRALSKVFDGGNVLKVYRYVDDFLILLTERSPLTYSHTVQGILTDFKQQGKGLDFTFELAKDNSLQFLDLNITLTDEGSCWMYRPRARKEVLPYESTHSKTVKRAIATMCLESALKKSCCHKAQASFDDQILKLRKAGFPCLALSAVSEALLKKLKKERKRSEEGLTVENKGKAVVIPYSHKVAHNLKHVAVKYKIPVVFSAPRKLATLCRLIGPDDSKKVGCSIKHTNPFVKCEEGVVYHIPMKCGKEYIGQTGRCINERLREHKLSLKNGYGSNLPLHCKACGNEDERVCEARLHDTTIMYKSKDSVARELLEANEIKKRGDNCISTPSLNIYSNESMFLDKF